ncbi:flotillin family protein, partial [Pseudomonas viridiflava]
MAMPFLIILCVAVLALVALALLIKTFYVKVPQGTALIVNDLSSRPKVYFTGAMVLPYLYFMEKMKISVITLEIDRKGKGGLICRDNMRADITVAFFLRVNETREDVLKVAKAIGVQRASDKSAVNELFNAKFSEALKTVGKQFDFVELFEDRVRFRDEIVNVIGQDLSGYVLEDVAIDFLEQTPKVDLDRDNILDAEGIRKITELTSVHNVITNELERDQALKIQKKNVETIEASLALERQEADAQARQKREIASVIAREEAETLKVQSEEHLRAEEARIAAAQRIDVAAVNHQREVDVANQN